MKKAVLFVLCTVFVLSGCHTGREPGRDYSAMVNPMVGTDGHGHTFPGATMPFGMVQLSSDTRVRTWDGCSGYHYSDHSIPGFSHTHFSGRALRISR